MEYYKHPPELSPPPPEYAQRPEQELPPPPPEFGQGSGAVGMPPKKRRLRKFLAVPALLLTGFLCFHAVKAAPLPAPTEPGAAVTEPTELQPIETATESPPLPHGSVVLDVSYAVRGEDSVRYRYSVFTPIPSLDATQEQIDAYQGPIWPVSVYAQVSDSRNQAVHPEQDPDVWVAERDSNEEYRINAAGLEGDLTLTLRAVYLEQGEERQTVVELPLAELPLEPALSGLLELFPGGNIDFTASLQPQPGDDHDYDLQVWYMGQYAYSGEERVAFSLADDPRSIPVEGDSSSGFTARYQGGSAAASLPDGAELSVYLGFKDLSTGYIYEVESNRVPAEAARQTLPTYLLADGKVAITVYNDTTIYDVPSVITVEDGYLTILDVNTFPESEFTGYALPEPVIPNGYEFAGWVIHVGNPFDLNSEVNIFAEYDGDPPVDALVNESSYAFSVGEVLTVEDVEKVPPSADGVRYVNVHAVWLRTETSMPLIYLDDGLGNETRYGMDVPLASEGYLYLCNYPVPEREGLVFDGWYDDDGNRVDLLVCYFSFVPMTYDSAGNFTGYDWSTMQVVRLTAHWRPESLD